MSLSRYGAAVGVMLFATSALAQQAAITFVVNASLTSSTCDVTVNGGAANATVTLPVVPASNLLNAGQVAGTTPWTLDLKNCDPSITVFPYFYSDQGTINAAGRLNNTAIASPAAGVELQLLNGLGGVVDLNAAAGSQNAGAPLIPATGAAVFDYAIQYYSTGSSGAGGVTSSLVYVLKYI